MVATEIILAVAILTWVASTGIDIMRFILSVDSAHLDIIVECDWFDLVKKNKAKMANVKMAGIATKQATRETKIDSGEPKFHSKYESY